MSSRRVEECVRDWWRMSRVYGVSRRVDRFFRSHFSPKMEINPWTPIAMMRRFGGPFSSVKRGIKERLRAARKARRGLSRHE